MFSTFTIKTNFKILTYLKFNIPLKNIISLKDNFDFKYDNKKGIVF
jgi:hypothetical protein